MWWLRQVRWPECLSLCLCIQRHMSDLVFNVLLLPWALCSWSCFFSQFPHPLSSSLSLPLFSSISADCSLHLPYGRLEYLDQIEYVRVTFCLSHHRGPPCFWGTFRSEGCRCACKKNSLNLCCRHRTTSTLLSPTECLSRFISILLCFKSYKSANETTIIKSECISSLSFSSI